MNGINAEAGKNLANLRANPYPGRGIVIGMDSTGQYMVQVYWVMGRSENSRNRILTANKFGISTAAADPAKVKDPSLIMYNAMCDNSKFFVVSNGHQTNSIFGLESLSGGLDNFIYEPDPPNFTPRISGVCNLAPTLGARLQLAILRKASKSLDDDKCDREFFRYDQIADGFGHCITTYSGDGNPLLAFTGQPQLLPINGDIDKVAQDYWQFLNAENRVALAVKFIAIDGTTTIRIINAISKVSA